MAYGADASLNDRAGSTIVGTMMSQTMGRATSSQGNNSSFKTLSNVGFNTLNPSHPENRRNTEQIEESTVNDIDIEEFDL